MSGPAPYHDHLTEIAKELADRASQGVIVLDATPLGVIETAYGSEPYEEVRQRLYTIFREQQGKDYRTDDLLTLDRPRGLRFVFFLGRKRRRNVPATLVELSEKIGARVIAAGIEAESELLALRQLRVPLGQGRHLAPPVMITLEPAAVP